MSDSVPSPDEYRYLIGVAYRILSSKHDAEDAVQEALSRWHALTADQRTAVREPVAWLTTVVSRACYDELGSARARREVYTGTWLPEPVTGLSGVAGRTVIDPADAITLDESISLALLVAMDKLTPGERVSLILHDVFGLSFEEVSKVVGRSPASCRQLASTARRTLRDNRPASTTGQARDDVIVAFTRACMEGDLDALVGVLDPAVVSRADGGDHIRAARKDVVGAEAVGRYLLGVIAKKRSSPSTPSLEEVNGRTCVVMREGSTVIAVLDLEVVDDKIREIAMIVNPEKLGGVRLDYDGPDGRRFAQ